jgi:hypothetical protein
MQQPPPPPPPWMAPPLPLPPPQMAPSRPLLLHLSAACMLYCYQHNRPCHHHHHHQHHHFLLHHRISQQTLRLSLTCAPSCSHSSRACAIPASLSSSGSKVCPQPEHRNSNPPTPIPNPQHPPSPPPSRARFARSPFRSSCCPCHRRRGGWSRTGGLLQKAGPPPAPPCLVRSDVGSSGDAERAN